MTKEEEQFLAEFRRLARVRILRTVAKWEEAKSTFLECSECGVVLTWDDYNRDHAVQDNWQDSGEDAYCPDCK